LIVEWRDQVHTQSLEVLLDGIPFWVGLGSYVGVEGGFWGARLLGEVFGSGLIDWCGLGEGRGEWCVSSSRFNILFCVPGGRRRDPLVGLIR